jgi:hypothetical protein
LRVSTGDLEGKSSAVSVGKRVLRLEKRAREIPLICNERREGKLCKLESKSKVREVRSKERKSDLSGCPDLEERKRIWIRSEQEVHQLQIDSTTYRLPPKVERSDN